MEKYKSSLFAIALLFAVASCKNEQPSTPVETEKTPQELVVEQTDTTTTDTLVEADKDIILNQLNRINLEKSPDDSQDLSDYLESKNMRLDQDQYLLDFDYPYLLESANTKFAAFNEYLAQEIVNTEAITAQILEDRELLCDSLRAETFREKRYIDYKIYNTQMRLLSVLFYKENFYTGAVKPAFSYQTVNFDLEQEKRLVYEDVFVENSEEGVYFIINAAIDQAMDSGQLHYDCFPLSKEDFTYYKHNFVIDSEFLTYYFDDCSICPAYIGSYSIAIPLVKLIPHLNSFSKSQFLI